MKILHIGFSPVTDGWNYQDNLLPKYHYKLGHEVWYITGQWVWGDDGKLRRITESDYYNKDGVKIIRLPEKYDKPYTNKFKRFVNIYATISRIEPDVLFIHGCQFIDIKVIVKYLKKYPNVVAYVDNHADFSNSATNWLSKNILHRMIWKHYAQLILPYTKKFYGVLPARVDFLKDIYKIPKEKIKLLMMGVDDDLVGKARDFAVRQDLRNIYNISKDDFLIMTGGKIDLAKHQTLLLMQAVQEIPNDKVKLIVFGSVVEELRDTVLALADGKKVQYIGWVKAEDSLNHFSASDLVIFPGRHSVFWEQVVALGKPLIVKYWEGATHIDIGGNCGYLYDDSMEEIIAMICRLVDNPEQYNQMKLSAENMARSNFLYSGIAKNSIS